MYHFSTSVRSTFPAAVAATKKAFERYGFSILAEIDIQSLLVSDPRSSLNAFTILSACHQQLARRAVKVGDAATVMLICEVAIRQCDAGIVQITTADPSCIVGSINNVEMISIADDLRSSLQCAMDSIGRRETLDCSLTCRGAELLA